MCVPVFWLAQLTQLAFAVHGVHIAHWLIELPSGGDLVLPASVLAVFQAGAYADALRKGISARTLFATFAALLPAIMSADVIIETIFAWPGVGRMFYLSLSQDFISSMFAVATCTAAIVLFVRAAAAVLAPKASADDVLEPL
jgi:ABC-type dipeptide/oligopeptide/nickel transport system permease component